MIPEFTAHDSGIYGAIQPWAPVLLYPRGSEPRLAEVLQDTPVDNAARRSDLGGTAFIALGAVTASVGNTVRSPNID
jgi:hypothetical protein